MFQPERILLVGDTQHELQTALVQALPSAQVTAVINVFDAIAELSANTFSSILAAVEPIERRPDAAVKALRRAAGASRLVLFGHPTLEPVSRRMLEAGADDYLITPPHPGELAQVFGTPPVRLVTETADDTDTPADDPHADTGVLPARAPDHLAPLAALPLADLLLEALLQHPADAASAALDQINVRIGPALRIVRIASGDEPPSAADGQRSIIHPVRAGEEELCVLQLIAPAEADEAAARHLLAQLAQAMAKLSSLQDRHSRLQKLAITDDLTGLYNGRYFRHFLSRVVEKARDLHFPVTLLLFDIDNFKKYNDRYGHAIGDEILKQTAALMRTCVREHDLVARISGDEFAVVFWEKDGPRQPHDGESAGVPGRPPQTPLQVFQRFQKLLATQRFRFLGPSGQGSLSISGGLAVYPWDADSVEGLIKAADEALMFGAKQTGKNSIYLVGGDSTPPILQKPPTE